MDGNQTWYGGVRVFGSCRQLEETWNEGHYFDSTPSQQMLQAELTSIMGQPTLLTTRGMTAIEAVILRLTEASQSIACSRDIYPGTKKSLEELKASGRLGRIMRFDPSSPESLENALKYPWLPRLVFVETFGNAKTMPVANIPKLMEICQNYKATLVIDTTLTPLYRPEILPNVIVVCSLTKDWQREDEHMGGFITARQGMIEHLWQSRIFQNRAMTPEVAKFFLEQIGGTEDRYLQHCLLAQQLAIMSLDHSAVAEVWYPGLVNHPQYEIVERDHNDFGGGVFYLRLKGGSEAAEKLVDELAEKDNDWQLTVSFGSLYWRILPFLGPLREYTDCDGLVRVASGRSHRNENIEAFKKALDSLV